MAFEFSTREKRTLSLSIVLAAVVFAIGLSVLSGLIPDWGAWYSQSTVFRDQVDAFLRGRLTLSDSPLRIENDLIWANGGVHQVWGLGVPLWRLPFVAVSRLFGAASFPDMFAVALAIALVSWLVLRQNLVKVADGLFDPDSSLPPLFASAGTPLILLLFPPFIGLLHSRFDVYEEVVAYGYLFAVALLAGLLSFGEMPGRKKYYLLCLFSGLAAWIRPTFLIYGLSTVLCGWIAFRSYEKEPDTEARGRRGGAGFPLLLKGTFAFSLGGIVLFGLNLARFGSGFEFGHHLTINAISPVVYASRFENPFASVPVLDAARELFGFLFRVDQYNGAYFYQPGFFPGQSSGIRFREAYLTTFDWSYIPLLVAGLASGLWSLLGRRPGRSVGPAPAWSAASTTGLVALWTVLPIAALTVFYLRTHAIASRHMLDYMPAFAALGVSAWRGWCVFCSRSPFAKALLSLSLLALTAWLAVEISGVNSLDGRPRVATGEEVQRLDRSVSVDRAISLPAAYSMGTLPDGDIEGIPYNGSGWMEGTGLVKPVIIFYVQDPEFLELEVTGLHPGVTERTVGSVQAKIGLEPLELETVRTTAAGWALRFSGPKASRYQKGIQVMFVAFVPKEDIMEEVAPLRLLQIRWRKQSFSRVFAQN